MWIITAFCTKFRILALVYGGADGASIALHSGRRSFITRLANKGINVRLLAALAGHSSIQVTQRYIDVNPDQLSAAVELL